MICAIPVRIFAPKVCAKLPPNFNRDVHSKMPQSPCFLAPLSHWPILTMIIMSHWPLRLRLGKSIAEVLSCVPNSRPSERDELQGFVGNPRATKWWEKWDLQTWTMLNPLQKPVILAMVACFSKKLAICKTCGWISRGRKSGNLTESVSATIDGKFVDLFQSYRTMPKFNMPSCCTIGKVAVKMCATGGWGQYIMYTPKKHSCIAHLYAFA